MKKTLILAHFFVEKGHAVSAVTIDSAKIFSQLMSESRSLAKLSERRLQSLLVCEIIDCKLGFSTLLQGQRGHGTVPPPCMRLWCVENFPHAGTIFLAVSEQHRLVACIEEA